MSHRLSLAALLALGALALAPHSASLAAPVGGFLVHLNGNKSNSDSRRSVTFYDADTMGSGPLFSVAMPMEFFTETAPLTDNNYEETTAITIDPLTGDVYVLAFDSVASGAMVGDPENDSTPYADTQGDYDLYRIRFAAAYNHWSATFAGLTAAGRPGVGGTTPQGFANANNIDYVTYGIGPRTMAGEFNPADVGANAHANTFVLPGVVEKIGEVNRNNPGTIYNPSLNFVNDSLMLLIDNTVVQNPNVIADDNSVRALRRTATTPGAATPGNVNGGYNRGASQSWESTRLDPLDLNTQSPPNRAESSSFYADPDSGVRGLWVTGRQSGGDALVFYEVDAAGAYLRHREFALPASPTRIALQNNPNDTTAANNIGKADNVFVDKDSGDVLIVESGFNDAADGVSATDSEPSVLRMRIGDYDAAGKISIASWDAKQTLAPVKDFNDGFLERGQWSAWDSANDRMYFINPGSASEQLSAEDSTSVAYQMDVTVLDMRVGSPTYGQTTTHRNIDDYVNLFFGDSFEDAVDFVTLPASADFDGNGLIDGGDVLAFQRGAGTMGTALHRHGDANGDNNVNAADLAILLASFPVMAPPTAAVPEPVALLPALTAACGIAARRRRA